MRQKIESKRSGARIGLTEMSHAPTARSSNSVVPEAALPIPAATQPASRVRISRQWQAFSVEQLTTAETSWHVLCIRECQEPNKPMNTQTTTRNAFESTYAMIVRSEEKERGASEGLIYGLLVLSAIALIWQLALHPVVVPTNLVRSASAAQIAPAA